MTETVSYTGTADPASLKHSISTSVLAISVIIDHH